MDKRKCIRTTFLFMALAVLILTLTGPVFAVVVQEAATKTQDKGITTGDVFNFIVAFGYIAGVFILLPIVIYTNMKEKLQTVNTELFNAAPPVNDLTVEERNQQAEMILAEIEKKLTHIEENGEQLVTITKGSQARFMRNGLDYITQNLKPTDQGIIDRMNEFITVYNDRSKRIFTGSKWIIGFAVGTGAFFIYVSGFHTFMIIHFLGTLFYILSSRTPLYVLEKRVKFFGRFGGVFLGSIVTGLFVGAGADYYKVYQDGRKERDYQANLDQGFIAILILAIVAMVLGFLAAFLGVVNFVLNYMNNFTLPFKLSSWYEKNFALKPAMA